MSHIEEQIKKYTSALEKAKKNVSALTVGQEQDSNVETRKAELLAMKKDELADLILKLERVKDDSPNVSEAAKILLEDPDCACLSYKTIAEVIRQELGTNTSDKSIGWYASNKKADWTIAPREKIKIG